MMPRPFRNRVYWIAAALISCAVLPNAIAQYRVSPYLFKSLPSHLAFSSTASADSTQGDSARASLHPSKSVATAVLLSAVLPGAGQIYTQRYWKVPIILGFGSYFAVQWSRMNKNYQDARSKYRTSVDAKEFSGQGDPQLLYERDFYHDERDRFAFYFALTYLLNLVDAYVGASLYDFDVGDNLTGGTTVKISIPIN